MDVAIPADASDEELKQIQKVLQEAIAESLELHPEDIEVTIDPETHEVTYDISVDDPTLAEETKNVLKTDDFVQNVNKEIVENSKNLPERIRDVLEIQNVNVDEKKVPSQVTGTMDVAIPADASDEELKQIQKVLQEAIAESLELHPEDIEVTIDPETHEVTYHISVDDPTLAEETKNVLKTDDFVQNVNKEIVENSKNLPERIRDVLEIQNVNDDEKKVPSQVTGTMDVAIPADASDEELKQIQKVLQEAIAESLELHPEDIEVTIDPETHEVTCHISVDDPTLAEETKNVLKTDDFVQNVNKEIVENSKNLPERIRDVLEIQNVNVDEKKVPSQVTGTMDVAIPADASDEELKQIQKSCKKQLLKVLNYIQRILKSQLILKHMKSPMIFPLMIQLLLKKLKMF